MKVTYNWLKQYVDFSWTPDELTERLTMLGLEVESVQKLGGEFDGVVIAQVLTKDRHPNADKLWLCRVNDGQGERQIVCGAQNFKVGDKVPLVTPGVTLPSKPGEPPFTIKVARVRGVESHGMMCSPQELGLPDAIDGLLILREDATVGQPFAQYLGRSGSDVVYDLEITPNRPDLNSVIGIAREISALTGNPVRRPEVTFQESEPPIAEKAAVRIEAPDLCPRYTARLIQGVKIGPSPDWLRNALEKVGLRSINNVVDVTNFVMLETGQPLHAFDSQLIAKNTANQPVIVVRRAQAGEKFITLDGQSHELTGEMLLIADEQKGIALAGVMGGQNSEINDQTSSVLLESACFKPANIRRTSKSLGLRTDASYRFERGVDIESSDWASQRATQLIQQTAGGQVTRGVIDAYPAPTPLRQITLRHHKVNELLGLSLRPEECEYFLGQLGLKITGRKPQPVGVSWPTEPVIFQVPSFRPDLKRETDLIEEIGRLYGVDKIPSTPPRCAVGANDYDAIHDQLAEARYILVGLGLDEAQGQTLIPEAAAQRVTHDLVALANPLSSDMNRLRPSLLPGLLDSLRHNLSHKNSRVTLFEIGRVFAPAHGALREERRVAMTLTGRRNSPFWCGANREDNYDLDDLKGAVEEFLEQFGVRGMTYTRRNDPTAMFLESATIHLGKQVLGEMGQLPPPLARQYDLRDAVVMVELNLDLLLSRRNTTKQFKALPLFPSIRRDVAMIVTEATTHAAVLEVVKRTKPQHLESVELFDVFRGKNVPEGQKSLAYTLTYRNPERTLTDAEVNATHTQVIEHLKQQLNAVVREG
jgi:phenylalanyl-tRNA synthetase beta chain